MAREEFGDQSIVGALVQLAAAGSEDWDAALQHILRIDAQMLGIDRVGYWTVREEPPSIFCELIYMSASRLFERGPSILERSCPTLFARLKGDVSLVAASDARHDPFTSELNPYFESHGVTSMLAVAIRPRGRLVGMLAHEIVGPARSWTSMEQQFALAVSQSLVTALEARARTRAEVSERAATFLAGASWVLAESRDPEHVAERAVKTALPTLGEDAVLFGVQGDKLHLLAFANEPTDGPSRWESLAKHYPIGLNSGLLVAKMIRRRQSILIPKLDDAQIAQYADDPAHATLLRSLGDRSVLAVLLVSGERISGAMLLSRQRPYDQSDLRVAEEYGQRVATALDNALLFTQMRDALKAREEFITVASHELSTPLASLRMAVDALDRKIVTRSPELVDRTTQLIRRQTERLEALVRKMLDSSEIAVGQLVVERKPVNLAQVTSRVAEKLQARAQQKGSTLRLDASATVWVRGDSRRLEQLVSALVENAVAFGSAQPIDVVVEERADSAMVSVRDHGKGIAPEQQARIFDRFCRGGLSTRAFGGFGLGLFVARGIAEAHGGRIKVESQVGVGSTFTIELPRLTANEGGRP